jgi:hypothetical protein
VSCVCASARIGPRPVCVSGLAGVGVRIVWVVWVVCLLTRECVALFVWLQQTVTVDGMVTATVSVSVSGTVGGCCVRGRTDVSAAMDRMVTASDCPHQHPHQRWWSHPCRVCVTDASRGG